MTDNPNRSMEPIIEEAQGALKHAMDEACRTDLRKANTGELIRVEEALQTAAEAAKEVVSLRLKRRNEREQKGEAQRDVQRDVQIPRSARDDKGGARDDKKEGAEHRVIMDEDGIPWAVVAVYPSSRSVDQGTLPERFNAGWLLFEHGTDVRRHAPVPANWQSLSDRELGQLCRNAEIATKRITPMKSPEAGS